MELRLKSGIVILIDDADWACEHKYRASSGILYSLRLCDLPWRYHSRMNCVVANHKPAKNERRLTIKLDRLLLGCAPGEFAYHINRNPLDNRRANLRVNLANAPHRIKKGKVTPYKGVLKERNRYRVKIQVSGKQLTIARCCTALEGAFVYDDAARKQYGDMAILNFPERKSGSDFLKRKTVRSKETWLSRNAVVYSDDGTVITIELANGSKAILDSKDWTKEFAVILGNGTELIVKPCDLCWMSQKIRNKEYVYKGNSKSVALHRLITQCPPGFVVDHIDGNTLNNRQSNLRICTNAENIRNSRTRRPGKIRYKGVHPDGSKSYLIHIQANWRIQRLRKFKTALEAAFAYDKLALELHGEFACLNFPERHKAKAVA